LVHKIFLKKIVCYPERVTRDDFKRVEAVNELTFQDFIHYAFVSFQARRISQLVFLARAMAEYQQRGQEALLLSPLLIRSTSVMKSSFTRPSCISSFSSKVWQSGMQPGNSCQQ
jgi:hypothetical protein